MINLRGNFSVANVERHIEAIAKAKSEPIKVKTRSEGGALGGEASFSQAILTWAARNKDRVVGTWIESGDDLSDLAASLHGLCSLLVAGALLDAKGFRFPTEAISSAYRAQLDRMDSSRVNLIGKGQTIMLLCADHLGQKYGRPRCFYGADGLLIEGEKYGRLFDQILQLLSFEGLSRFDLAELGGMIFELIQNTDRHAVLDLEGNVILPSVRGLYARRWDLDDNLERTLSQDSPGLEQYIKLLRRINFSKSRLPFIEISVFDSGPGLAATLLNRSIDSADPLSVEVEAVVRCFSKNESRFRDPSSGLGLDRALNIIRDNEGLLRVRTGRVSLYLNPIGMAKGQSLFRDWKTASDNYTLMPRAEGTLITILLPMVRV